MIKYFTIGTDISLAGLESMKDKGKCGREALWLGWSEVYLIACEATAQLPKEDASDTHGGLEYPQSHNDFMNTWALILKGRTGFKTVQ